LILILQFLKNQYWYWYWYWQYQYIAAIYCSAIYWFVSLLFAVFTVHTNRTVRCSHMFAVRWNLTTAISICYHIVIILELTVMKRWKVDRQLGIIIFRTSSWSGWCMGTYVSCRLACCCVGVCWILTLFVTSVQDQLQSKLHVSQLNKGLKFSRHFSKCLLICNIWTFHFKLVAIRFV